MDSIGQKLKYLRVKSGHSRQYIAENICDESTLFRIEKGAQLPRVDVLKDICRKLNVSVDYVIGLENESTRNYFKRIKHLCRESLYANDYSSLQYLIEEAEQYLENYPLIEDRKFRRFLNWVKAISFHKCDNNPIKAETALRKLLNPNTITTELDLNISNSLALVLIENEEYDEAFQLLSKGTFLEEMTPHLEDKSLYPRINYNLAYISYMRKDYDQCINTIYRIEYYLLSNQYFYLKGESFHLLGLVFEKKSDYESSIKSFNDAVFVFLLERKNDMAIRTLRALAEVNYKKDNLDEGARYLEQAMNLLKVHPDEQFVKNMFKKIKHTENQYAKKD